MKTAVAVTVALWLALKASVAVAYVKTGSVAQRAGGRLSGVSSTWVRARLSRSELAVRLALRFRGVPYVWGGASPRGFDCSGLVQYVFRAAGIRVPRTTWTQMRVGRRVSMAGLRRGDAVFLNGGGHEGLYLGNGLIVNAPRTGAVVRIDPLDWYRFTAARRFAR